MTLHSILCPVDFSEQSRHALRWAEAVAARTQGRLTVLNVVDPLLSEAAKIRLQRDLAKETKGALGEFAAAGSPGFGQSTPASVQVLTGTTADVIVETATRDASDLIVMGTQGLGGVRKWILGSTTERVLRRTPCAVLAVPPPDSEPATIEVRRILLATDFSEASVTAAKYAAFFCRQFSAALAFAHVVEPVVVPVLWRPLLDESDQERAADARARLKRLADSIAPGSEIIASAGYPSELIGSIAEASRASLVVMGLANEEGPFARRPGSIAYRVLSSSSIPVLVVPRRAAAAS